ncbi:MAG: hypothetical protein WCA08_15050 [Desulfoferrobacter sp.]
MTDEDAGLFENDVFRDSEDEYEEEYDDCEDPEPYYILEDNVGEDEPHKAISEELPAISDDEQALVNEWWEDYKTMQDVDQIRLHLEGFMREHPSLVVNLELHHEVLFELGAAYNRLNRNNEYIDLLIKMRNDFPASYIKSFGYYDSDIIAHKVITERKHEIGEYLSYFREYPAHDPDSLFKTINFMMATNCQDLVSPLVREIYYEVCTSPEIFGGDEILESLVQSYFIPFLRADFTSNDMEELAWQLESLKFPLNEDYYNPEYLQGLFACIFGTYPKWSLGDCKTRKELFTQYHLVCHNFMRFLKEEKGKDWMAAAFYRNTLFNYLANVITKGKKPKEDYVFSKNKIDQTIMRTCRGFLSLDSTMTLVSLSSIYWFAEYLASAETISQERKDSIQLWCTELYQTTYPVLASQEIEARAFAVFPS